MPFQQGIDEFEDYKLLIDIAGDSLWFSQDREGVLPYVRRYGQKWANHLSKPAQITKIISNMYFSDGCNMHYSFFEGALQFIL